MTEEIKTEVPPQDGQTPVTPAPSAQQDGQAKTVETQDNLPEKFKGKTAGEIAKSYLELEKRVGEQSKSAAEAKETRAQLAEWEALGKVLEESPALYKQVEDEIKRRAGTTTVPQTVTRDDTRIATETILINNFEKQYSIDTLPQEQRSEMHKKIGAELAELLDPAGKKSVKEIMDTIPLDRLPKYLDKAYRLATIGDEKEHSRLQALAEARQNSEGAFSSMTSSSPTGKENKLTDEEKKVAARMNISEEKYLKSKQTLNK